MDDHRALRRLLQWVLRSALLALLVVATPAAAAVSITFYSKELGSSFPHAFVTMAGAPDRGGAPVNVDYGFTAKAVTPAILWGRVAGEVISNHGAAYIKGSDRHFTLALTDEEYDRVMATIARWRQAPQPSYDLNHHNCVHFVAELAASIGLKADTPEKLMKKPRSYVEHLTAGNRDWLTARHATFYRTGTTPLAVPQAPQPLRVP